MAGNEVVLTDANFQAEVIESDVPVLVDFWATWCGPCRMVAPIIEQLADEFQGKAKVCKLNVEDAGSTAGTYQISSIPTIMLFKGGQVVQTFVGARSKAEIEKALTDAL